MDKIIFDVKCDNIYAIPTKLEYVYGVPYVTEGELKIYPCLGGGTIEVEEGRFNSAEKFVIDVISKKHPNTIVLSRKKYALSLGLNSVSKKQLAKSWRKSFRLNKLHNFLFKKLFPKRYKNEVKKRLDVFCT
jgi:hypothetical protein